MDQYEFDLAFQESILSLILRDTTIVSNIRSVVNPNYFTDPALETICDKAIKFVKEFHNTPTLSEFLEFGQFDGKVRKRIKQLYRQKIRNHKFLMDRIVSFAQFQAMKSAIIESSEMVGNYENHLEIQSIISKAMKVGVDITKLGTNLVDGRMDRYVDRELKGVNHTRIPTGLRRLDRLIGGGVDPGELAVVMGIPKGFKTGTLVNIGVGAMKHRMKVAHFTLEVSEVNTAMRYERCASGLDKHAIVADYRKLDSMLRRIERVGGGCIIKEFPAGKATVMHLVNHIETLVSEGFDPDVIIVDYGDLLRGNQRIEQKRLQLSDIYTELRAWGQEGRKRVIWTASQATRKAIQKKVIGKEDVAEDIGKVAIADLVIAFCQTTEEKEAWMGRLYVAASRESGEGGTVECKIDYDRMKLKELDQDE